MARHDGGVSDGERLARHHALQRQRRSDTGPFALVPEWLLDSGVSDGALRQYAILARYADADGVCWPSTQTLAERQGCSEPTVKRRTKELVEADALVVAPRYGEQGVQRSNLYVVLRSIPQGFMAEPPEGVTVEPLEGFAAEPQNENQLEVEEPAPRSRRRTARDDYFDVLVEVYGKPTPKRGASFYASVVSDIMEMPDATPDELRTRARLSVQRYGAKSGPGAVAKNWSMLSPDFSQPQTRPTAHDRAEQARRHREDIEGIR